MSENFYTILMLLCWLAMAALPFGALAFWVVPERHTCATIVAGLLCAVLFPVMILLALTFGDLALEVHRRDLDSKYQRQRER